MLTFIDKVISFMSLTSDTVKRGKFIIDIICHSVMNKERV